jgi:hypothetical protein
MRKILVSACAFFVFTGPVQAATAIIVNANNTALPSYTTAQVFQTFDTNRPSGSEFLPNTTIVPGTAVESVKNPGANIRVVTKDSPALAGMDGDYLYIGNGAAYTLDFSAAPITFFSFVFNSINNRNHLTFNYADGTVQNFNGLAILGSPANAPLFGRVSYDVGLGSRIESVSFSGGEEAFTIDSIASAAPEPSTWALMILGFGLIGAQLRRRKGLTARHAPA